MADMSIKPALFSAFNALSMAPIKMAASMPSGLQTTLNNIMTAGQAIGGGLAGIFLVISGIKFMHGSRDSVESSKLRLACVIVGVIICAGCSVLKTWLQGLMNF
jgi:hypothetical protein